MVGTPSRLTITPVVVWVLCSALPLPRSLKSLPWPKLLTTTLGVANCNASTLVTPFFSSVSPPITEADAGVVIRFSLRRSAVTMMTLLSSCAPLSCALVLVVDEVESCAAAAPLQAKASADAPSQTAVDFICPSPWALFVSRPVSADIKLHQIHASFNVNYRASELTCGQMPYEAARLWEMHE